MISLCVIYISISKKDDNVSLVSFVGCVNNVRLRTTPNASRSLVRSRLSSQTGTVSERMQLQDSTSFPPLYISQIQMPSTKDDSFVSCAKFSLHYAPGSSRMASSHLPCCRSFSSSLPSSVNSGFPRGVVLPLKNHGFHSTPFSCLIFAFSRCFSSISCLTVVALWNCLERMADVRPDQKRRDSISNCWESGGMILGCTERGTRSIRRI